MKGIVVIAAGVTLATAALALHAQQAPAAPATVPPPPGMDEPGVNGDQPASAGTAAPTPGLRSMRKLLDEAQVEVHRKNGNVIEEYRRDGRVYMVRVTPPRGVTQTYMVDPDGKLRSVSGGPPVSPVMYKILDFGQPPEAVERKSGGDHDGG